MRESLQTLLAERFQLVIRKEAHEASGYALVVAKGGSRLVPSTLGEEVPPGTLRSRTQITGRAGTMHMLAALLSNWLAGRYRIGPGSPQDTTTRSSTRLPTKRDPNSAGSIFAALHEQRTAVERIVRLERPSANREAAQIDP
jgi:uncharacterized protein (TIGR03435 family)